MLLLYIWTVLLKWKKSFSSVGQSWRCNKYSVLRNSSFEGRFCSVISIQRNLHVFIVSALYLHLLLVLVPPFSRKPGNYSQFCVANRNISIFTTLIIFTAEPQQISIVHNSFTKIASNCKDIFYWSVLQSPHHCGNWKYPLGSISLLMSIPIREIGPKITDNYRWSDMLLFLELSYITATYCKLILLLIGRFCWNIVVIIYLCSLYFTIIIFVYKIWEAKCPGNFQWSPVFTC